MLKRIRLWFTLFPKKASKLKHTEIGNALHVVEIDPEGENLHEGLGIIDKRCDELSEICKKAYTITPNVVASMEIISKECKHANELFFCSYILTRNHIKNQELIDNPLSAILGDILKRRNRE